MASRLDLPLDSSTVEGLRHLGRDLINDKDKREAFLKDRSKAIESYGIRNFDVSRLDERVVNMLADPSFHRAVEGKDFNSLREYVHNTLGSGPVGQLPREGTFDFDFDVEVEVEVVAVAIAVFDFAATAPKVPNEAELMRRREIVAQAFQALGKTPGQQGTHPHPHTSGGGAKS